MLYLKALYLEPDSEPDEDLIGAVAEAMRNFLSFHIEKTLAVANSQPSDFGQKLMAAL